MRMLVFFCLLIFVSCVNKEKVAAKDKLESNINKDSANSLIVQKGTISATSAGNGEAYYALNNQIYSDQFVLMDDVIFEKGKIIKITDTITAYDVGIFKGKWFKGHHEKKEFLIPSFYVIDVKEMAIPNFKLLDIIEENQDKISYSNNVTDAFSSYEEITFKSINDIEVAYFLIKAIYERENNRFPLTIKNEGKIDEYLEVSSVRMQEGLEELKMKWLFEGGDLIINFKKNKTGILVTIYESFG